MAKQIDSKATEIVAERVPIQEKSSQEIFANSRSDTLKETLVTWDGPDDPLNPRNWSTSKRMINIGIISCIGFLTPLSSAISSPATPQIQVDFHSSSNVLAGFVTSIYVLGNAIGPIFFAPASEIWGRSILFHVCNILFLFFTLGCALSTSIPMLLVFRFLAGCVGGGPLAIGGGTIGEIIPLEERGKYTAIFATGALLGPIVGPIAGGYLTFSLNWRWSFWLVTILGGFVTVVSFIGLSETHTATVLKGKARRLRKERPNATFKVEGEVTAPKTALFKSAFVRPMKILFTSPAIFALVLFQALSFGYIYLLFSTFPVVFGTQYGFNAGESGLTFIGFGLGCLTGLFLILKYSDRITLFYARRAPNKEAKPEFRLYIMLYGVWFLPVGLIWYGWTAQAKLHWIVPIIGTFVLALGIMAASLPANLYIIDYFTVYAASGLAANAFVRSLLGGLIPLAGGPMYARLGYGWGNSLLGFIALAFCVTPIVIIIFGEKIRKRFPVNV